MERVRLLVAFLLLSVSSALGQWQIGDRPFHVPPGTGTGTFTIRQTANCAIASSSAGCSLAFGSALISGNLDVFSCDVPNGNNTTPQFHITAVTAGGTLVTALGASTGGYGTGAVNTQRSWAYILPATSTGGSATEKLTLSGSSTSGGGSCWGAELVPSSSPSSVALDLDGSYQPVSSCGSSSACSDIAVTQSGANDAMFKSWMSTSGYTVPTSVSSPYSTNDDLQTSGNGVGFAAALTGGAAETWGSGSNVIPILSTLAFGWNATNCKEESFINFSGVTNGVAPSQSAMASSIAGWQGADWYVGVEGGFTGSTSYNFSPLNAPGRMCGDGSSPSATVSKGVIMTATGAGNSESQITYMANLNSSLSSVSESVWFCSTLTATDQTDIDVFSIHSSGSEYVNVMFQGNGNHRYFVLETDQASTSGSINYTPADNACDVPGDWVNLQLLYNYSTSLSHELAIFNSSGAQVGSTLTMAATAAYAPSNFSLGNYSQQNMTSGAINAYSAWKTDLNGTFPLTP